MRSTPITDKHELDSWTFLTWLKDRKMHCTEQLAFSKLYDEFQQDHSDVKMNSKDMSENVKHHMKECTFKGFKAIEYVQMYFLMNQPVPVKLRQKLRNAGILKLDRRRRIIYFQSADRKFERDKLGNLNSKRNPSTAEVRGKEAEPMKDDTTGEEMDNVRVVVEEMYVKEEEESVVEDEKPQLEYPLIPHVPIGYEEVKHYMEPLNDMELFDIKMEDNESIEAVEILHILRAVSRIFFGFPQMRDFYEQVMEELSQPGRDASMIPKEEIRTDIHKAMDTLRKGAHTDASKPNQMELVNFLRVLATHFVKLDDFSTAAEEILEEIRICEKSTLVTFVQVGKVMNVLNYLFDTATPAI